MPELSIRKIIEKTLSGEIRIPSFQRGFVWEPEKVAFFIDSLYKGYHILQCWFLWLNFLALQKRGARHLLIYNDRALSNGFGGVVFLDATTAACIVHIKLF